METQSSVGALSAFLCILVPLAALLLVLARNVPALRAWLRRTPRWRVAATLAGVAMLTAYGGGKGGPAVPARVLKIVAYIDGVLRDPSGAVASASAAAALEAFGNETAELVAAAQQVVSNAQAQCDSLVARMATNDYSVAYVRMFLPRGNPAVTNHNLMITCEAVERIASNRVDRLVWFSQPPVTNVTVYARYRTSGGHVGTLSPTTNHWPATETVNGVECVRYEYTLPDEVTGYTVVPSYEISLGGPDPGQYLKVPAEGVVVAVGATNYLPHTGWDDFGDYRVRSVGGIAVEIEIDGTSYTGVNP